jgi:hypothetical protein
VVQVWPRAGKWIAVLPGVRGRGRRYRAGPFLPGSGRRSPPARRRLHQTDQDGDRAADLLRGGHRHRQVGDISKVGRIGLKAIIYFEVVTTFALVFGLAVGNLVKPGAGFNVDPATLDASALDAKTGGGHLPITQEFLLGIIPDSVVGAFAENTLLAVLFFSCLFGIALAQFGGGKATLVLNFIDEITHVIFRIIGYIMKVAPIGAFGAMAC